MSTIVEGKLLLKIVTTIDDGYTQNIFWVRNPLYAWEFSEIMGEMLINRIGAKAKHWYISLCLGMNPKTNLKAEDSISFQVKMHIHQKYIYGKLIAFWLNKITWKY